jgi:poly-beta-1,6-N-acetyl-D-glucosamine N-deacetylase
MSRLLLGLALLLGAVTGARAELAVLRFADVVEGAGGRERISRQDFAAHLDWLGGHGYEPVSLQQVLDARAGGRALPERAVLLSFDGGHASLATEVWPLLRAYGWKAVAALPTARIGFQRGRLDWGTVRQIEAEGTIEFISAGHVLDGTLPGEPRGLEMPAAATRAWLGDAYEDAQAFAKRINDDLDSSQAAFERGLGRKARAIAWPDGAWTPSALAVAQAKGFELALAGAASGDSDHRPVLDRVSLADGSSLADLVAELRPVRERPFRAIQIDLDYVYDENPAQLERNLDALLDRVRAIAPTTVWLQAFADPDGDGAADAVYFPNRHLPVRADLLGRVAWLLQSRAHVAVHAWMPVLGWKWPLGVEGPRTLPATQGEIPRLDPSDPLTAAYVGDLYQDMATHAPVSGLLFHDDALLREQEIRSEWPEDSQRVRGLVDLTRTLEARAEAARPRLATARNLYARPLLEPAAVAWFAQDHASMLAAYDRVALMAMPWMEGAAEPLPWLQSLVQAARGADPKLAQTVFVLQARDWNADLAVDDERLIAIARGIRAAGARHLAYYPDDFINGVPSLVAARQMASARRFPYLGYGERGR